MNMWLTGKEVASGEVITLIGTHTVDGGLSIEQIKNHLRHASHQRGWFEYSHGPYNNEFNFLIDTTKYSHLQLRFKAD